MLVSIVAGLSEHAEVEVDRYGAWSAALRRLREALAAGAVPIARLVDFLTEVPADQRFDALQDLIAAHLEHSWRVDRGSPLEAYLAHAGEPFGAGFASAAVPAELVEDEFLARHQLPFGDLPPVEEYARRFPGRGDIAGLLQVRCLAEGRYVKLARRGQGAMGDVFEAVDRHLRRLVALKLPRSDDERLRARFAEEARLTAGLEHPGIVGVHEFHDGGAPFYVMRLVNGASLGERIRDYHAPPTPRTASETRLAWNGLVQSLVAVCDAIAFAHAAGIVHRDLKPGNIVVGSHGETVILDWGVGKRIGPAAASGSDDDRHPSSPPQLPGEELLAGTPEYMAPEQADGQADCRSDVFGLGAVLYELLTGRPPRLWAEGARPADWAAQVRTSGVLRPGRLQPRTPRPLEAVCMKALAPHPDQRYASAAELARELRRYLALEPVAALRERIPTRLFRRLRGR